MAEKNNYIVFAGSNGAIDPPKIKLYAKHALEEHWTIKSKPFDILYPYQLGYNFSKISPNGQNILVGMVARATSEHHTISLSLDYGETWNYISTPIEIGDTDPRTPNDGCMNDDSSYILIATDKYLYLSNNSGSSYTKVNINKANQGFSAYYNNWVSVDMSDDGRYMFGVIQDGHSYRSDDYGAIWSECIYNYPRVDYFAMVDLSYTGDSVNGLIDGNYTSGGVTISDNNPAFGSEGHIDFFFETDSFVTINKIGVWANKLSGTGDIKFYLAFLNNASWSYYKYIDSQWVVADNQLDAHDNPISFTTLGGFSGISYITPAAEAWTMRLYMVSANDIEAQFYEVMFDNATYWKKIACDSTGKTVVVVSYSNSDAPFQAPYNGFLFSSIDHGLNLTRFIPNEDHPQPWSCVALSGDGNKILLGQTCQQGLASGIDPSILQGKAYIATKTESQNWNDATSWIEVKPDLTGVSPWYAAAMSDDGNVLMICGNKHKVYSSYDGGNVWKEECPTGDEIGPSRIGSASYQYSGDSNWNWTGCSLSYSGRERVICCYGTLSYTSDQGDMGAVFIFASARYPSIYYKSLPSYDDISLSILKHVGLGVRNHPSGNEILKVVFYENSPLSQIDDYTSPNFSTSKNRISLVAIQSGINSSNPYIWSNTTTRRPNLFYGGTITSPVSTSSNALAATIDGAYIALGASDNIVFKSIRLQSPLGNDLIFPTFPKVNISTLSFYRTFSEGKAAILLAGYNISPYVSLFDIDGDVIEQVNTFPGSPVFTSEITASCFSHNGLYLVIYTQTLDITTSIRIYKNTGDDEDYTFLTYLQQPAWVESPICNDITFSYNDKFLILTFEKAEDTLTHAAFIRNGDSFTAIDPSIFFDVIPTGSIKGIASSKNKYLLSLAIGTPDLAPYMMLYEYGRHSSSSSGSSSSSSSSFSIAGTELVYNDTFHFETYGDGLWFLNSSPTECRTTESQLLIKSSGTDVSGSNLNNYLRWIAPEKGQIGFYWATVDSAFSGNPDSSIIYTINDAVEEQRFNATINNKRWVFHSVTLEKGDIIKWTHYRSDGDTTGRISWLAEFTWNPYTQFYDKNSLSSSSSSTSVSSSSRSSSSSSKSLSSRSSSSSSKSSSSRSISSSSSSSLPVACWQPHFIKDVDWTLAVGTWDGSKYTSQLDAGENTISLIATGSWAFLYRPIKVRISFDATPIAFVAFVIQDANYNFNVTNYYYLDSGPSHEVDINFSSAGNMHYLEITSSLVSFTVSNIEFDQCASSSSSFSSSSSSKSSTSFSSSSGACADSVKLTDVFISPTGLDQAHPPYGSWNAGTQKWDTEVVGSYSYLYQYTRSSLYEQLRKASSLEIRYTGPETISGFPDYLDITFEEGGTLYNINSGDSIAIPESLDSTGYQALTKIEFVSYGGTDPWHFEFILHDDCGYSLSVSSSSMSSSSSSSGAHCWESHFDNSQWSAGYGTWDGSHWNSVFHDDGSGPGYGNVIYLTPTGGWASDGYRPIKVRVSFVIDSGYMDLFDIQDASYNEIVQSYGYPQTGHGREVNMDFSIADDIYYLILRSADNSFYVTNIEFFDCASSSSSSCRSSSSSSSRSSSSESCITFFELTENYMSPTGNGPYNLPQGSWNGGTGKWDTEANGGAAYLGQYPRSSLYNQLNNAIGLEVRFTGPESIIDYNNNMYFQITYVGDFGSTGYTNFSSGHIITIPETYPGSGIRKAIQQINFSDYNEDTLWEFEFLMHDDCGYSLSVSSSSSSSTLWHPGFPLLPDYMQVVIGDAWSVSAPFVEDEVINLYNVPGTTDWTETGADSASALNRIKFSIIKYSSLIHLGIYALNPYDSGAFWSAAGAWLYTLGPIGPQYTFKEIFDITGQMLFGQNPFFGTGMNVTYNSNVFKSITYISG